MKRLLFSVLTLSLLCGCTYMPSLGQDSLGQHIQYMNRAAKADPGGWEEMKNEAEQRLKHSPVMGKLQLGWLLTGPEQTQTNSIAGEQILRELLEEPSALDPRVRDLVELRFREVERRKALVTELEDVRAKIEELMSIEQTLENERNSDTNTSAQ